MSTEAGTLRVTATGKFSLAEAKRTFVEMMSVVERQKVGRVLFDARLVVGNPNVMERFYYGQFVADMAAPFWARTLFPASRMCLKNPCSTLATSVKLSR